LNKPPLLQPSAERPFYGWQMMIWSTVAISLTAPGQTVGVSAFRAHFIEDLSLSDTSVSSAYAIGTITGALFLPAVGRWVDRSGVKRAMTVVVIAFSVAVAVTGAVQGFLTLTLAFVGIRMLGQGSLSLVSQTGIALWFNCLRGRAIAFSMTMSAGFMSLAPILLTLSINTFGWRWAWVISGATVLVILLPVARLRIVDRPETLGQLPDGEILSHDTPRRREQRSFTVSEAIRTRQFWSLALVMMVSASLVTGLTLHHFELMKIQGLSTTQAGSVFIPQAITTIITSFIVAWLTDLISPRFLQPFSMLALGAAMLSLQYVSPGFTAYAYGALVGLNSGSMRAISSAYYPKWFGTGHVGAIRGVATSIGVGASALGPLMVSLGLTITGSYPRTMLVLCVLPVMGAVAGFMAGAPEQDDELAFAS